MDISFDATPPAETLPPNMTLHRWDVRTDIPEHLEGKFDLVHIRYFAVVILESDVRSVLEKLIRLLSTSTFSSQLTTLVHLFYVMKPSLIAYRAWWLSSMD